MNIDFEFEKLKEPLDGAFDDLEAEMQHDWLLRLHYDWENINYVFLKNRLKRAPVFVLFSNKGQWAYWDASKRTIGMNRDLLCTYSWETVLYVLKHELAHQYASEILFDQSETSHGPSFQAACDLLGIPATSSCSLDEGSHVAVVDSDMLRKIKKMLALATSANEHEAKTAMAMANKVLLKYNLDKKALSESYPYRFKYVDSPIAKVSIEKTIVSNILQEYFFVKVLWCYSYDAIRRKKASRLQVSGTAENIEVAEYVYFFLLNQADHLWLQYKKKNGLKLNKMRKSFALGLLAGFREKLQNESINNKMAGLVWLGDADLDYVYKKLNPNIKSTSYGGSQVFSSAMEDGKEVGRKLNLHMGIEKKGGFGGYLN